MHGYSCRYLGRQLQLLWNAVGHIIFYLGHLHFSNFTLHVLQGNNFTALLLFDVKQLGLMKCVSK